LLYNDFAPLEINVAEVPVGCFLDPEWPGEGYWVYSCNDTSDAYIPKNNLLPEDRFERYRPKYVSLKEARGKSVEKDPWEF